MTEYVADFDASALDTAALESYLSDELAIQLAETRVLDDGLNLMLALSTAEDEDAYVLRRPNKLRHTELFNGIEREYELLGRLRETAIPTSEPAAFCDDESILGGPFFVATFLEGETIPLGSGPPERFRTASARRRIAERSVETLADVHSLDVDRFENVCERHAPLEQVARAIDRLEEAARVTGRDFPALGSVGDWLRRNAPSNSRTTLVHGDFRPGNLLFSGADRPELAGVIDWETAMLGDPLTELGYLLLRWRDEGDPTPSLEGLEARYANDEAIQKLRAVNETGLAPFTANAGSPTRRELVARYERETGFTFEHERFYRTHAAFMLATVWAELHRHAVDAGVESDWEPWIEYVAMIATSIVNGEFRL